MARIRRELITAILAMVVLTLLLGVAYPLLITGVGQVAFPSSANGRLVRRHGHVVGSTEIGLPFTDVVTAHGKPELDQQGNPVTTPDPRYFQTRPSATTPAGNAAATTFSNLGPNNQTTVAEIRTDIQAYLSLERPYDPGLTAAQVPVDAADTSASGIDPQISLANARIQAHRVAAVRHLPLAAVTHLVSVYTSGRSLGLFGEPAVNVLKLNLALDRLTAGAH